MKIGHIELFVQDVEKSKDFYCDVLGFKLVADQNKVKWVKLGDVEILLRPGISIELPTYQETPTGIVFYTNDLEKTAATLREKGLIFKGTDGSENCLTFTDPDGHWFQLVNPYESH